MKATHGIKKLQCVQNVQHDVRTLLFCWLSKHDFISP